MTLQQVLARIRDILDTDLFEVGGVTLSVGSLLTAALIIGLTFWLSWMVRRMMARAVRERSVPEQGSMAVTARLLHYTILFIGFTIALGTLGIQLTALFAAGAVFAVAIGFAMQNITANFVSGVILLFERSIKPGDIIEVDGRIIKIRELGIRSTIARGMSEEDLIIPNSSLVQSTVKNYTLRDTLYRLDAEVGVSYGSDMAHVRSVLEGVAEAIDWRLQEPEPVVMMREFGTSSVNFLVTVYTNDPWRHRILRSILNEAIWNALLDAGITIAFPQMDVHFDPPIAEALAVVADTGT
ncbi:MAG: mechanosensitive ion channel [Gemmatimonadota bacterium]|nr:mechanosensitive ion channel [Gemmatimonadota bacterium]MDH3427051.1 mechanosensitive ion channel [Gemmatimonadota bacterium]